MLDAITCRYDRQNEAHNEALGKSKNATEISVDDLLKGRGADVFNIEINK